MRETAYTKGKTAMDSIKATKKNGQMFATNVPKDIQKSLQPSSILKARFASYPFNV
jgi:hypothetical protein